MRIIHSGFDTIAFAIQGALSPSSLQTLRDAKDRAIKDQADVSARVGPNKLDVHVKPNGQQGGYAYILDMGPLNFVISFKDSLDRLQWNGFVKIRAMCLAVYGWRDAARQAMDALREIGFTYSCVSLNRVDYCMDFHNLDFSIDPDNFVMHSRAKAKCIYKETGEYNSTEIATIMQSNKLQSITIGKMPGRQIIVYDKLAEVISKKTYYWFEIWGLKKDDLEQSIIRVEIRAGKHELDKYILKTWEDFEAKIGDVMLKAVKAVRYSQPNGTDTNASRRPLHPLWENVTEHVKTALLDNTSNVEPSRILYVLRSEKCKEYQAQTIGNMIGMAVCLGIPFDELQTVTDSTSERIKDILQENSPLREKYVKKYVKVENRLQFEC